MTRQGRTRLAAWLGLFAMLMAFAGPLYSQLRALDSLSLSQVIDLEALHCGEGQRLPDDGPPAWVEHLAQCGYCELLAGMPVLPAAVPLSLPAPSSAVHQYLAPRQSLPQAPPASPQPRGPPSFHA